jgi:hypothetical protein
LELHINEKSVQSVFSVVGSLEIHFGRQVEPRWEGAEAISQGGARALGLSTEKHNIITPSSNTTTINDMQGTCRTIMGDEIQYTGDSQVLHELRLQRNSTVLCAVGGVQQQVAKVHILQC